MSKPRPTSKPPRTGRKRRTLGWTLLTLGLLVAGVWGASRWWRVDWHSARSGISVHSGLCIVYWDRVGRPTDGKRLGWTFEPPEPANRKFFWRVPAEPSLSSLLKLDPDPAARGLQVWLVLYLHLPTIIGDTVGVVFWPIPLLLWTPAALLLRSGILARRRANTGSCAKCGYSLAGLAAGAACPECGRGGKLA